MKLRKLLLVWRMHWLCAKQEDGKVLNPIGFLRNKSHSLGSFPTLEKAIEARDIKGRQLYGEFYRP